MARWRPEWTKSFIREEPPECFVVSRGRGKQRVGWVLMLFILSFIGFASSIVQLVPPMHDLIAVMPSVAWVSAIFIR